jgi:hypothetical protein
VLLAALLACQDGGGPVADLPPRFRLVGEAESTFSDGRQVRCQFALQLELGAADQRTAEQVRYPATHEGSAGRTVQPGFSFVAQVPGPAPVARYFPPDSVELLLGDTTLHDSRFWREIAFLAGRVAEGGVGAWRCAPLDINQAGVVDTSGIALGEWRLEVEPH